MSKRVKEFAQHKKPGVRSGDGRNLKSGSVDFPVQYCLCNTSEPRYDSPVHWHSQFELIHIIRGEYNIFIDHKEYKLKENDMCIIPCNVLHGDSQRKSISLYESVVFDIDMIRLKTYLSDDFFSSILSGDINLNHVIPSTNEMVLSIVQNLFATFKDEEDGFELKIPAWFLLFFGEIKKQGLYEEKKVLSPNKQKRAEQFSAVLTYIEENYKENITLEGLASIASLSPIYFCRLFHEVTGRSPVEYLNWFRVNMACDKLRKSSVKIFDIAVECGFNDFSYFIKTFRRYKDTSPLKYRNMEEA